MSGPGVEDSKQGQQIYDRFRDDLLKRHLSNSENFDRAILTYSSAGLALSFTVMKDFVSQSSAIMFWCLYCSWLCFVAAILVTVSSYPTSQKAIDRSLELAELHYIKRDPKAFEGLNVWNKLTNGLNVLAGCLFSLAVILTMCFVTANVGGYLMDKKNDELRNGASIPRMQQHAQDGALVPRMQAMPKPETATNAQKEKSPMPDKGKDK